jgi:hypothetical protein
MNTRLLVVVGLFVALSVVAGVGLAAADSFVNYNDGGSFSEALFLGGNGLHAFVFGDKFNPPDYYIHAVDTFANLLQVTLGNNGFPGFAFFLFFEGFNGGFKQYAVYSCLSFSSQTCNVSTVRRGSFFIQ